jgi:quercetin dioxygenase-like cupin family protein
MLKAVAEELKSSDGPVVKKIHNGDGTMLLAIGLKKGVVLAEHTAPSVAKLIMIQGEVNFNLKDESFRFTLHDTYDIPWGKKHNVLGVVDAIFLLLLTQ